MKRCPKCQNLLPVDARFCMQCGQAFDGGSAPSMPTARPLPPARKPWWIAVVVGVLLLAGIGFGASSLLKASGRPGPSDLLKSQGAPQGDLLRAAAKPAPDMMRAEANPPAVVTMPPEIRDYLEHVHQTELRRKDAATKHLAEAQTMMMQMSVTGGLEALKSLLSDSDADLKPPTDDLKKSMDNMKIDWVGVSRFLDSKTAPAECNGLRQSFATCIQETGAQLMDVLSVIAGASENPTSAIQSLEKMKGSSKLIDDHARRANDDVKRICEHYHTQPWFEISADFGSRSMLSAGPG